MQLQASVAPGAKALSAIKGIDFDDKGESPTHVHRHMSCARHLFHVPRRRLLPLLDAHLRLPHMTRRIHKGLGIRARSNRKSASTSDNAIRIGWLLSSPQRYRTR